MGNQNQDTAFKTMKSLFSKIINRINSKYSESELPFSKIYIAHVSNKNGLEIGGPSYLFKKALPLYKHINNLDGVNFAAETYWEGKIKPGLNFKYMESKKNGLQFISEGTNLSEIKDGEYDFVLSSNCLEHIANPIKALMEWRRVIKENGYLILVVPNKASNFDHRRPTTSFDHIFEDFNNDTTEDDLTHLDEILALHDLTLDPPAGDIENFRRRSLDNFRNRTLHHHVFDFDVIEPTLKYCGFEIIERTRTHKNFYVLSKKLTLIEN